MKIILGLTFLLLTSRRSEAQDDSLAGSFLSGRTMNDCLIRRQTNERQARKPYLLLLNISAPVCATMCV